jgi:hypothetical protein
MCCFERTHEGIKKFMSPFLVCSNDYERVFRLNLWEDMMFEVTEKANEIIKDFLKDKKDNPSIRLFLSGGG